MERFAFGSLKTMFEFLFAHNVPAVTIPND